MTTTTTYTLQPQFDSAKSFYSKAKVNVTFHTLTLISYTTEVAEINLRSNTATVNGTYSNTTLRHIKEFLKQNGFKAESKKQIEQDYIN